MLSLQEGASSFIRALPRARAVVPTRRGHPLDGGFADAGSLGAIVVIRTTLDYDPFAMPPDQFHKVSSCLSSRTNQP